MKPLKISGKRELAGKWMRTGRQAVTTYRRRTPTLKTAGRYPSDEGHLPLATGCDKTPAEASHRHALKSSILSDVPFDKFFLTIAVPNVRCHSGLLGLSAV